MIDEVEDLRQQIRELQADLSWYHRKLESSLERDQEALIAMQARWTRPLPFLGALVGGGLVGSFLNLPTFWHIAVTSAVFLIILFTLVAFSVRNEERDRNAFSGPPEWDERKE